MPYYPDEYSSGAIHWPKPAAEESRPSETDRLERRMVRLVPSTLPDRFGAEWVEPKEHVLGGRFSTQELSAYKGTMSGPVSGHAIRPPPPGCYYGPVDELICPDFPLHADCFDEQGGIIACPPPPPPAPSPWPAVALVGGIVLLGWLLLRRK